MYKASKFVATLGYSEIATKIITCSHKKVGWPLPIDISTFNPSKIHDGSFANIDNNHHASPPHFSWDVIDEEDDVDHEELVAYPVRALFSIALTDPKIKAKNNIRLMTCILPRGTVVVGPGGRQVLDEAGEYRICPPSDQTTPVEDDTQLDFVTDDVTLTSFASQHVHQSDNNHRAFAPITNDNNKPTSARSLITGPISDIDSREAVEHNGTTNTIQSNITRQPSQTVMSKFQGNISESKHMFERIMDKLSIKPDWAAPDGRWNPTKNRLTYDSSRTEFFENSMTSSELPSPRMSIQIIPACSGSVPSPKARSVFELRMLQAYQKLLVEGVTAVKHRTHPLERLTKISTLGRNISEVEPETMVQEAFAAACPKTSPDEVRDRYINHIYERQELRCQSLSRLHRIKDAAFAESNEFGFSVREAYPAGKRPEINAVGPVERASTPASKVDQMDLAFMTLPMPPGCAIISPSGYVMNLDTFHRGPVDGEAPLGQGGIYSFFLPQMAKHLAADFQPWLHDWVGFKFCFPQAIGLVLHGKWLPRWTTSGAHQIVEVDGELDLLSPKGRYRLFNGMQPIGTPVNKEPRTADIPGMVMQEAQQILRQYKQDPLKDIKREQFQEARQINIDKLASKRLQTTLSKQKEQGQLQYDISGEISDLLEEDSEDADSASSGGNFDPRQHKAEKKLKGQVKEKKKILITLRTTPQQLAGATGQPLQSGSVPTRSYERKSIVPIVPSGSGEEETDTKRGSSPHGHNHEMIHSSTQIDVPSTRQCRQINNIPKSQPKTLHIKRKVGNVSWDEDEIEMAETPSKKSTAYVRQDTKIVRLSTRSTKFTRKTSDRVGDLKATPRQTNVSVHDVSSQSGQPSSGSTTRRRNGRPVIPSTMGGAMVQQARMLPFLPKAVPTSLKTIAKKPQSLSSECTIKASQATGVKPIVRLPPKLKYDLKSARKIDTSDKLSEHVTKSHAPFLPAKPPSTTYSSSYNDDEERCTRSSMPKAFGSYAANLQQLAVGTTRAVPPLDPSSMMISDQRFGHAVSTTPSTAACIKQQSTPNLPSGPPPIVGPPPQSAPSAHNTINGQQSMYVSRSHKPTGTGMVSE